MIEKLDEKNFEEKTANGVKLIEFSAKWCGFCKKQEPILEEMDKVWIGKVDGDESPELTKKFGISGFPSFLILKDGNVAEHLVGLQSKYDLMNTLTKYIM